MEQGDTRLPEEVERGLEGADRAIVIAFRDGEPGMVEVGRAGRRPDREALADELDAAIDHLVSVKAEVEGCTPFEARWR